MFPCNKIFNSQTKYIRSGASPTIAVIVPVDGEMLFGKIYFNKGITLGYEDFLGVEYEKNIYENVVPELLKSSPNFIPYKGSLECSSVKMLELAIKNPDFDRHIRNYIKSLNKRFGYRNDWGKEGISGFFTSYIDAPSIGKELKKINSDDWAGILAQILMSIRVMIEHKINHNDLLFQNILIQDIIIPAEIDYSYKNKKYKITSRYMVYIFDWDYSYVEGLPNPKLIESQIRCYSDGLCNRFAPKSDVYTLLCQIVLYFGGGPFISQVAPELPNIMKENQRRKIRYPCRIGKTFENIGDAHIPPIRNILRNSYFKEVYESK